MHPLDFALMIHALHDHGVTREEIAKKTGISKWTQGQVKNEMIAPPAAWFCALELLDLYLIALGSPPKLYPEIKK